MNKYRLTPLLLPLGLLILSEVFFFYPKLFFVSLSLGLVLITFGLKMLASKNKKRFWPSYLITPFFLWLSFSTYSSLASNSLLIQIVFVILFILLFSYFKNIYYYLFSNKEEFVGRLETFSFSSGILIVFTSFSSIYTLPLFINLPQLLPFLLVLPFIFALFFQNYFYRLNHLKKEFLIFSGINALILSQLSWALSLLPLRPDVLGFLVALGFYFLANVFKLSLKDELNRRSLKWVMVITAVLSIMLLLSSRWL